MRYSVLVMLLLISVLALSGCGGLPLVAPTPLPTVVLGTTSPAAGQPTGLVKSGGATASGVVAPARLAQVAASTNASLRSLDVAVGDSVKAGQALARLSGAEKLSATLEAANLELLAAQQAEKALKDNSQQKLSAAQVRLANARKVLDDAQKRRAARQYRNGTQSQIEAAQAKVILANIDLKNAEDAFVDLATVTAEDDLHRATALNAVSNARLARDRAVANLNYLLAMPNPIDVAQADAAVQSAQSELEAATKEVELLKNGPDPDALALVEQRIKNAKAQIAAAQAALDDLTLKAPFDGVVSKINIHAGEWVLAGQAILVLADLKNLRVETTDLSERNVPQVRVGGKASIWVKALGQTVSGKVKEISPLADTLGGDVVYKTLIDLDSQPDGLRSGMTVDVQFEGK